MPTNSGFVKLYRSILDWSWYDDHATCRLFIHLLLRANWSQGEWHGVAIQPGQLVTSTIKLATETGLSRSAVVRSLTKLKKSGEVDTKSDNNRTLVTLVKWAFHQGVLFEPDNKTDSVRTIAGQSPDTIEEGKNTRTEEQTGVAPSSRPQSVPRSAKGTPEERVAAFKELCRAVHAEKAILSGTQVRKWFDYWTEISPGAVKHRWELEKTFDIAKRMTRWRDSGFNPEKADEFEIVKIVPAT